MIQKMKKIVIVAPSERKAALLDGVRDLGLVHVTEMAAPDSALSAELNDLNRVRTVLQEAQKAQKAAEKKKKGKDSKEVAEEKPVMLDGAFFNTLHKSLLSKIDERSSLSDGLNKLKIAKENIAKWGDFDPSEVNKLKDAGFTNITCRNLHDVKIGLKVQDGKVQSIRVADKVVLAGGDWYPKYAPIVISYHGK